MIIHRMSGPLLAKVPQAKNAFFGRLRFCIKVAVFFHLVCLGWLVFRAQSIAQALDMLRALALNFDLAGLVGLKQVVFYIWVVAAVQIFQFLKDDLMVVLKMSVPARAAFYFICFYLIMIYGVAGGKEFVYFQF